MSTENSLAPWESVANMPSSTLIKLKLTGEKICKMWAVKCSDFALFSLNKAKCSGLFFSRVILIHHQPLLPQANYLGSDKSLIRINFQRWIGHIWTMILNNHMFNLYIRSPTSHRGPFHRPVLQIERQMAHMYSKATLQSSVCISKESKIDRHMQFGQFKTNFVQFIWQWATYECVCYIDMLHRDEPIYWYTVVIQPSLWFSVCNFVETLKVCHTGGRPPTTVQCRVTERANKSSRQLLNPH